MSLERSTQARPTPFESARHFQQHIKKINYDFPGRTEQIVRLPGPDTATSK